MSLTFFFIDGYVDGMSMSDPDATNTMKALMYGGRVSTTRAGDGYVDGYSLYFYVGNMPLKYLDPMGLVKITPEKGRIKIDYKKNESKDAVFEMKDGETLCGKITVTLAVTGYDAIKKTPGNIDLRFKWVAESNIPADKCCICGLKRPVKTEDLAWVQHINEGRGWRNDNGDRMKRKTSDPTKDPQPTNIWPEDKPLAEISDDYGGGGPVTFRDQLLCVKTGAVQFDYQSKKVMKIDKSAIKVTGVRMK